MASKTKRRTPLILGICIAVVVVVVICVLVFVHPWNGDSESGGDVSDSNSDASQQAVSADNSGVSKDIVSVVADGSVPLLSNWEYFDTYWQKCDPTDATYCETSSDGAAAYYRLCDDYSAGQTVGSLTILEGAKQTNADDAWDVVTLDCSTGEITWWSLSPTAIARIQTFDDLASFLESKGFIAFERGWFGYVNTPINPSSYQYLLEDIPNPNNKIDDDTREAFVSGFSTAEYPFKCQLVEYAQRNDWKLMDMLVECYGEDEIDKFKP